MRLPGPIEVRVINLERDDARRARIRAQFDGRAEINCTFISGVLGRSLPTNVTFELTRHAAWSLNKGTLGCFLSHVSAWESIAQGTADFGVVLEDDVDASKLPRLLEIDLPDDAEIIFLNDRMSPIVDTEAHAIHPIYRSLLHLDGPSKHLGPGGDGYLLSRSGAEKLLAACKRDLYYGHVDGRLLRYSVDETDLSHLPAGSRVTALVRSHHHPRMSPALGILKGYAVAPPLVRWVLDKSGREAEDRIARGEVEPEIARTPARPVTSGSAPRYNS